jgi:ABC-2 type transport system permease protein
MWERILEIVRKEFYQTLRDPRRRVLLIGPPILQLLIFGYAVNLDVRNARLAWLDQDGTPLSRQLKAAFEGSPTFTIVSEPADADKLSELLDRAEAQAAVRVLPGFSTDVLRGRTPQGLSPVTPRRW